MIKANELRVGNVIISEAGVVRTVTGHDIREQWWHEGDPHGSVGASINSIPLTPEWLERCGFKKDRNEDNNSYETYTILKLDGGIACEEDGYFHRITDMDGYYDQRAGIKIEFVHQLQNRYHSLTGEELNVKL